MSLSMCRSKVSSVTCLIKGAIGLELVSEHVVGIAGGVFPVTPIAQEVSVHFIEVVDIAPVVARLVSLIRDASIEEFFSAVDAVVKHAVLSKASELFELVCESAFSLAVVALEVSVFWNPSGVNSVLINHVLMAVLVELLGSSLASPLSFSGRHTTGAGLEISSRVGVSAYLLSVD